MEILFSIIVTVIFILAYVPQVKLLKDYEKLGKTPTGVSLSFWVSLTTALFITTLNFIFTESSLLVIVPQAINTFIASYVLGSVMNLKIKNINLLHVTITVLIGSLSILLTIFLSDFVQILASALIIYAYLSQIFSIAVKRNVDGLSIKLFFFVALALSLMIANIVLTNSYSMAIYTETFNLLLILIIIVLIPVYRESK
ncbi:hypothetical protein [Nosocomiicoccus ampullae]|uniref:hypothetical protein n=1 Tax=Nosocomiicoccus ampullae TaxID=489910 RepID=UPI001C5E04A9|nr:hypothetical protein [Nosocomiicoccus ampullae]QYA47989.1 hypothetical protein KPF52_05920 [Nosocomiicoccus ampullae]